MDSNKHTRYLIDVPKQVFDMLDSGGWNKFSIMGAGYECYELSIEHGEDETPDKATLYTEVIDDHKPNK